MVDICPVYIGRENIKKVWFHTSVKSEKGRHRDTYTRVKTVDISSVYTLVKNIDTCLF